MTETGLTLKQERAIAALLSQRTVGDAARVAGVGERTLHRWLKLPVFRKALDAARAELVRTALLQFASGTSVALDTLSDVMSVEDAPGARTRAADVWLSQQLAYLGKLDHEQRLARLEAIADELANRKG